VKTNGVAAGTFINAVMSPDLVSRLGIGDIIKARIIGMTSSELLLKLFDGTAVKAVMQNELDVKPGDTIELLVKGKQDNRLITETVKKPQDAIESRPAIEQRLKELDIKPDVKSQAVAKELLENEMPLEKEQIVRLLDILHEFKELKPSEAVFLAANNIKADEER
jgi:hypothetical protein